MATGLLRKLKFTAWAIVTTALMIELVMQIGALVVYVSNRPASIEVTTSSGKTILCVGDSWTHGMGSSDFAKFSYPGVLQQILRDRLDPAWTVVNAGHSGQNSRDVLDRLQPKIELSRPRFICILVGRNDYWTNPKELVDSDIGEIASGYRFRWRLPRLIAFVFDQAKPSTRPDQQFGPEWSQKPDPAALVLAGKDNPWRDDAEQIALRATGQKAIEDADFTGAAQSFQRAVGREPADSESLLGLAVAAKRMAKTEELESHLKSLESLHAASKDHVHGRSFVEALIEAGRMERARELAKNLLSTSPDDAKLWHLVAKAEFDLGLLDEALASNETCLRAWPTRAAWQLQARILTKLDRMDGVAKAIFDCYVACNDADLAMQLLVNFLEDPKRGPAVLERELAVHRCDQQVKSRLQHILTEAKTKSAGAQASRILTKHLHVLVARIRSQGITPVFLTYPNPQESASFGQPLRDVAAAESVHLIDVTAEFAKKLNGRPWEDVASPDYHVNDEGYRMMAECVYEGLQPLLSSPK